MSTLLLLDLDGTLIDTPHFDAWCNAVRQFGIEELSYNEYVAYMAGRPRLEGALRLIERRTHGANPDLHRAGASRALAQIKQSEFLRLCVNTRLFDDALRLLERLKQSRQHVKLYTASQNAESLLHAALSKAGMSLSGPVLVKQRTGQTREDLFMHLVEGYSLASVMLVDDAPHAVDAACSLGIQAYQILRRESQMTVEHSSARILTSLDDIAMPIGEQMQGAHNEGA